MRWRPPDKERRETLPSSAPTRSSRSHQADGPRAIDIDIDHEAIIRHGSTLTMAFVALPRSVASAIAKYAAASTRGSSRSTGIATDVERDGRSLGKHGDAGRETLGQLDRVDPVGDLAKVGKRLAQLDIDLGQDVAGSVHPVSVTQAETSKADSHRQVNKALLGSIVEVALKTSPFAVGRVDDPHPRGAELVELQLALGMQPLVLDRPSREAAMDSRSRSGSSRSSVRCESQATSSVPRSTLVSVRPAAGTSSTRRPSASTRRPSLTAYANRRPGSPSVEASRSRNWPGGVEPARSSTICVTCCLARRARMASSSTPAAIATSAAAWPYQNSGRARHSRGSHAGRRASRRGRRRRRTRCLAPAPGRSADVRPRSTRTRRAISSPMAAAIQATSSNSPRRVKEVTRPTSEPNANTLSGQPGQPAEPGSKNSVGSTPSTTMLVRYAAATTTRAIGAPSRPVGKPSTACAINAG